MKFLFDSQSKIYGLLVFIAVWIMTSLLFYFRYPENFYYANFFAEDGLDFFQNVFHDGFTKAILIRFNGYYIFGIYFLTKLGFILNEILYGGEFLFMPKSFAIISYVFLGLCAALPVIILRKYISLTYLLAISFLIALMPMPTMDYITIGTIGNLKFAFGYIAFIFAIYRTTLSPNSFKLLIVDAVLLLCIYTIATAYFSLLIIFIAGVELNKITTINYWKAKFSWKNISFWSALLLFSLALIQLLIIAFNGGLPHVGYLDEPYQIRKTIELFLGRSYLYPLVSWFYIHLNDFFVVLIFAITLLFMRIFSSNDKKILYAFGIGYIFFATLALVYNRTGISAQYNNYSISGFDNFFYAQNFVFIILIVFLFSDISLKIPTIKKYRLGLAGFFILIIGSCYSNVFHVPSYFMHYTIGTLDSQLKKACATDKSNHKVDFTVYPFAFLSMSVPRNLACTNAVEKYNSHIQYFGLSVTEGKSIEIGPSKSLFFQKFISKFDNLNGVAVYISTYWNKRLYRYSLYVMDENCGKVIRKVNLPNWVADNSYLAIKFDPIYPSKNIKFCFSIQPDTSEAQPLVVQVSENSVGYQSGLSLILNGTTVNSNVVFVSTFK